MSTEGAPSRQSQQALIPPSTCVCVFVRPFLVRTILKHTHSRSSSTNDSSSQPWNDDDDAQPTDSLFWMLLFQSRNCLLCVFILFYPSIAPSSWRVFFVAKFVCSSVRRCLCAQLFFLYSHYLLYSSRYCLGLLLLEGAPFFVCLRYACMGVFVQRMNCQMICHVYHFQAHLAMNYYCRCQFCYCSTVTVCVCLSLFYCLLGILDFILRIAGGKF